MPHCYDLVGTLAEVSYPWETLTDIIYTPRGAFTIITAQAPGPHVALYAEVKKAFPKLTRIHTVNTGTDKAEGERKAAVLKRISAHSYTDNNRHILDVIHELMPNLDLYIITNGKRKRYV